MRNLRQPILAAVFISTAFLPVMAQDETPAVAREKVTGIGGFFFRAEDPAALSKWYEEHLGIDPVPTTYEVEPWMQEAGPTVFSAFSRTSKMAPEDQQWVINLRVRDLDAMVAQLEAAGIEVEVDPETYPNGRFAGLSDPEGNPIQLWEDVVPEVRRDRAEGAK